MGKFFGTLKAGVQDFFEDECMTSGAALAYYTVFSLPPLLVLVFFVAGLFGVSDETIDEVARRQLGIPVPGQEQAAGEESAPEAAGGQAKKPAGEGGAIHEVARRGGSEADPIKALGPFSKVLGVLILIFSATGLFAQLQTVLNRAWEVEPDPKQGGWKNFITKRVLSLGMILVVAFLLLVSLVLTTLIDELIRVTLGESPSPARIAIGVVLNDAVTLLVATALFGAMFKFLPDAEMRWKDIGMGAFITALLFVIGKTVLGRYLQNSNVGSAWGGAAASMVALLLWVYYSSLIVLLGAELTQAWAKNYGPGIVPEPGAVRVIQKKQQVGAPRQADRPT